MLHEGYALLFLDSEDLVLHAGIAGYALMFFSQTKTLLWRQQIDCLCTSTTTDGSEHEI